MFPCELPLFQGRPCNNDAAEGLLYGGDFTFFCWQAIGVLSVVIWTVVMTKLCLVVCERTLGLQLSPEDEEVGLDSTDLGESAYDNDGIFPLQSCGIRTSLVCFRRGV